MEARLKQELPALPKPIRNSEFWDEGIEWALAGERAARLERERQLMTALETIATLRADASKAAEELTRVREEREDDKKDWGKLYGNALETANVHMASLRKVERDLARERERHQDGSWPKQCLPRAFVEGMKWWQFHHNGSTAFPSEVDEAEAEALRRYHIERKG